MGSMLWFISRDVRVIQVDLFSKTLGATLGAAVGDAMGAATEMRTTEQIVDMFGGLVKDFKQPPKDTFARNNKPGQVTDDFSLAYFLMQAIIRHNGAVTDQVVKEGLLAWSEADEYYIPFAGPTTRASIERLKGNEVKDDDVIENWNAQATNGSAMKIFPIGLINPGNLDRAIEDAVTTCLPTHSTHLSISGACAVAAAVSEAMKADADVYSVVRAGMYGAVEGEKRGKEVGVTVAGPSVVKRMELAVELALKSSGIEDAMAHIGDIVGSGIHVSEAVPAAFGLFIASGGETMEGIYAGVNIGNDTDTVATMVGAMAGALRGHRSIPAEHLALINERNEMDLEQLSRSLVAVARV